MEAGKENVEGSKEGKEGTERSNKVKRVVNQYVFTFRKIDRQIVGNTGEEGTKYRKETEEEASAEEGKEEEGSKAQKVNMRVEEVEEEGEDIILYSSKNRTGGSNMEIKTNLSIGESRPEKRAERSQVE